MSRKQARTQKIAEQMAIEEVKGLEFMKKLNSIKKKNNESKKRTKINTHKIDWIRKLQDYNKKQKQYEDELDLFISSKANK